MMLREFEKFGGKLKGHPTNRLTHNLNVRFDGIESKAIINSVSKKIAISAGSACTTEEVEPSHVLLAIGLNEDQSHEAIRIGLGRFNTTEEVKLAIEEICDAVKELEAIKNVFGSNIPKMSSTKSLTGHSLGATGVHEAIYSLLMMKNNFISGSAYIDKLDNNAKDCNILLKTENDVEI